MTMNAIPAPQSGGFSSDTDSDDTDVAFASMDFSGVDFGGDDNVTAAVDGAEEGNNALEVDQSPNSYGGDIDLKVEDDDCNRGEGANIAFSNKDHSESTESSTELQLSSQENNATDTTISSSESQPFSAHSRRKKALSSIVFPDLKLELSEADEKNLSIEKDLLLPSSDKVSTYASILGGNCAEGNELKGLFASLESGNYADILRSDVALAIFGEPRDTGGDASMMEHMKRNVLDYFSEETHSKSEIMKCLELEIIGIASLNLFLQLNYTGPSMDRGLRPEEGNEATRPLDGIHPHEMFRTLARDANAESQRRTKPVDSVVAPLSSSSEDGVSNSEKEKGAHSAKETNTTDSFHNAVLSELAIDGEWPYQVCEAPYFLLLARATLSMLAEPSCPFRSWSEKSENSLKNDDGTVSDPTLGISSDIGASFAAGAKFLGATFLWNARAVVAHRRLISTRRDDDDGQACPTLWNEAHAMFSRCLAAFCESQVTFDDKDRNTHIASEVMLEWGLAQHHFRKLGRGKASFSKALETSKLEIEVTGAEGKRTKYQQSATAQYLVRAKPSSRKAPDLDAAGSSEKNAHIQKQMIKHDDVSDDALLLERIHFEEQEDNVHYNLSILDQSILLALCLDVKNDNPMDGLTGEQMGAFLARVLNQHDDWMVYATALLERAWLECERTHGRERAILQLQALVDQHSNRLTLTQSSFKSVEEDSAPAKDRLRNLHGIVYPPRWDMLRDLAQRYAKLGVVTSAAEIFEELELWDDVVECYRIAGKQSKAEEVVRKRLAEKETPRMYAALGDLTHDPKYFERSLELSNGKFYDAHVALGKYYFEKGDLSKALEHFLGGLQIKPLMPAVWFRVGTISMQLKRWDTALRAFTEVVQQEPTEGDAWANVAAIHMHNREPEKAYPALLESLKQNRNNWRVWVSKLYTCIDLKRYDEAIQTCTELLNLKARKNSSDNVPAPEEKCIRAIVGGSLQNYHDVCASEDKVALDSAKRTLARVRQLLDKMKSSIKSEAWLYEVSVLFNEEMGLREDVFNDHMKEYRTLMSVKGWEEDTRQISKVTNLVKDICSHLSTEESNEGLSRIKLLIKGVVKKVQAASYDSETPKEVSELNTLLADIEKTMAKSSK